MKLLLHMCCAPCSTGIVEKFLKQGEHTITGYYYNPNIHPEKEHMARRKSVEALSGDSEIQVIYQDDNMLDFWKEKLTGEKEQRCSTCYSIRIDEIAKTAKEKGFDAFTSSLLISPWQNHEQIRSISEKMSKKYGIQFLYEDFRPLYREGKNLAYQRGYYLQKYCGCIFSYKESDHKKKPIYEFE